MTDTGSNVMNSTGSNRLSAGSAEYLLELLTVSEVAAALRVPASWVYERVRRRGRDRMPHLKIGKYLRFRLNDVRIWVDQGAAR